jgi:hypothetical protein
MSGSTTTEPSPPAAEVPGRYLIVQTSSTGLTMMIDTVAGRSWFRISAGPDHYAWRPMRFEPSTADPPSPIAGAR